MGLNWYHYSIAIKSNVPSQPQHDLDMEKGWWGQEREGVIDGKDLTRNVLHEGQSTNVTIRRSKG